MSRLLDTVQSDSNPGKYYTIIEGDDGVVYCSCMAWKMKKTCKHLKAFQAKEQYEKVCQ